MKRIPKPNDSRVILEKLKYPKDSKRIREILIEEQEGFCAYTEDRISPPTMAMDVEHFNPNLKNQKSDGYHNWFAVCHKVNNWKSNKWIEPILHPSDERLEELLVFDATDYTYSPQNIEAGNLSTFLGLNEDALIRERRKYVEMILELKNLLKNDSDLMTHLKNNPIGIRFRRALETVLRISFTS